MSPISREKAALYPKDWKAISAAIRERSGGRCECIGECGLHPPRLVYVDGCGRLPTARRCVERHMEPAKWARGKVVLTVAHLNHDPTDNRPENLKAMCNRCHLRYDVEHHQRNAAATRRTKKRNGELFALLLVLSGCATAPPPVVQSPPAPRSSAFAVPKPAMALESAEGATILPTLITYTATLPTGGGFRCADDTTHRTAPLRMELWFQKQSSPWAPPWFPHYAPAFVAASRDSTPGAVVSIALPDTFSYGTLIPRARNSVGLGCDGNLIPSRWTH